MFETRCVTAQFSHPANGKHSQAIIQSIRMANAGRHFIHSTDDLMPQLHWGISDYLTAMLDGNQEAPPRDTNAGSAHRITSLSLFPPIFNLLNISLSYSCNYALLSLAFLVAFCFCLMSFPL